MRGRTFAIGDIHGDLVALRRVLERLPPLDACDTVVFLGDYLDRGPSCAQVVELVRRLAREGPPRVIALRGNHEDAWLRVIETGWPEFVSPPGNGCLAAMRSFTGGSPVDADEHPLPTERERLYSGSFFPEDVVAWLHALPHWYEDDHAIYVHAGLPRGKHGFAHPSEVPNASALLWLRDEDFFRNYRGKLVVFGHTATAYLPPELSTYTPEDPHDIWAGPCCVGLDTGAGKGGFLTALELPTMIVYESR
ncbi:MAG: serine/threonine protein phosphatase [Myxococcota bacterium]|nr:serine/threonine protein phosphatase [Myxococcota bacterium]